MASRTAALGFIALSAALLAGCELYNYVSGPGDLGIDGVVFDDTTLKLAAPDTEASKSMPVVIAVHGFGATAYETGYAAEYLTQRGILVSRPNMGKHGTATRDQFGASTWREWEAPIRDEYTRLVNAGYKSVGFLTISTGGPVVMELVTSGVLNPPPRRISMVAPLLDFDDKRSGLVPVFQMLGAINRPSKKTGTNIGKFYADWPAGALRQLVDLTEVMKARLRRTVTSIPVDTKIQIFQSMRDKTVDPLSAQLWANGIKGPLVSVFMIDSDRHVPIGVENVVDGKGEFTADDKALRDKMLDQVAAAHKN
jgi:carboxylesterase